MSLAPRLDRLERNVLINGGFDFFQRGTGALNLSTSALYVSPDRFRMSYSGTVTGTPTASRSALVPNLASRYSSNVSLRRNGTTATIRWEQRIEAAELYDMAVLLKGCFSAQFYPTAVSGATARLTLNAPAALDNYTSVSQIYQSSEVALTSSAWTLASFSDVALSSAIVNGLAVVWEILLPSATDGAAVDYYMAQAMAHAGSKMSAFVRQGKSVSEELENCQRFYEKSYQIEDAPGSITGSGQMYFRTTFGGTGAGVIPNVQFSTRKRSNPAMTAYNPDTGSTGQMRDGTAGANRTVSLANSERSFRVDSSDAGVVSGNVHTFHWVADAEL